MSTFETVLERVYTIPFYPKLNSTPRTKRAPRAMRLIKEFLSRHLKSDDIIVAEEVNEYIQKPPRKITVRAVKSDDDVIEVFLVDTSLKKELASKEIPATSKTSEREIDEEEFDEEED